MKRLTPLNFRQARSWRFWGSQSSGLGRLASVLALSLGGLGAAVGGVTVWEGMEQERQLVQRVERLQQEAAVLLPNRSTSTYKALPAQEAERQARIIHQLNLPWAEVLSSLEALRPDGVALLSMEPAGAGSLRLQTESKSLERLLSYATALRSHGPFGEIVYTRHETNERDPNRPVRLSFEIALKGRVTP